MFTSYVKNSMVLSFLVLLLGFPYSRTMGPFQKPSTKWCQWMQLSLHSTPSPVSQQSVTFPQSLSSSLHLPSPLHLAYPVNANRGSLLLGRPSQFPELSPFFSVIYFLSTHLLPFPSQLKKRKKRNGPLTYDSPSSLLPNLPGPSS